MNINIPFYTDKKTAPICITDRDGDWSLFYTPHQQIISDLYKKYSDGRNDDCDWIGYSEGDPRLAMGDGGTETLFVAVHNGVIGVLSEIELNICHGDTAMKYTNGTVALTTENFNNAVEHWKEKLTPLAENFPHSEILLAGHAGTYDGRICLCAFTPLLDQGAQHYQTPYKMEIMELDKALIDIAYLSE